MNRKEALKKLGLSFGVVIASPVLFHASCTKKSTTYFFNELELQLLIETSNIIIPGTNELPKASEVGVAEYIDHYVADIVEDDEQKNIKSFMQQYMGAINAENTIEYWVENTFSADWDTRDQWHDEINNFETSIRQGLKARISDQIAIFALLTNLKSLMIRAYRGSELVGEQYLAYDPIPGRQVGCIDLAEATGGRIWSL
tara:strand:- start:1703 stop:2302 length:600 start_codon:yes stop_codon:yes gene_type:complete